jgi:hypothetical protein
MVNNARISKEMVVENSHFTTTALTNTAIAALKTAYEECTETSAKKSIITAFKAVIQLHHDLGNLEYQDKATESDVDFDPSEYCAAV